MRAAPAIGRRHIFGSGMQPPAARHPPWPGDQTWCRPLPSRFPLGLVSWSGHVPAGAGVPWAGSPVGGIFDPRPDALAGHRLVIEARDDMQVGMEPVIVPAECVAVRSEPL